MERFRVWLMQWEDCRPLTIRHTISDAYQVAVVIYLHFAVGSCCSTDANLCFWSLYRSWQTKILCLKICRAYWLHNFLIVNYKFNKGSRLAHSTIKRNDTESNGIAQPLYWNTDTVFTKFITKITRTRDDWVGNKLAVWRNIDNKCRRVNQTGILILYGYFRLQCNIIANCQLTLVRHEVGFLIIRIIQLRLIKLRNITYRHWRNISTCHAYSIEQIINSFHQLCLLERWKISHWT